MVLSQYCIFKCVLKNKKGKFGGFVVEGILGRNQNCWTLTGT